MAQSLHALSEYSVTLSFGMNLLPVACCSGACWQQRIESLPAHVTVLASCPWSLSARARAASGEVPAREGVVRLMDEARAAGLLVGVCSAATKSSAICVLESLLGKDRFNVRKPLCFP